MLQKASKTGLKIKLNVNATKLKPGGTVVSTPETPPFAMPLSRPKRAAKRRVVEPSDDEIDDQEEEEEEEEADSLATPVAAPSQPARMTARQAALAGGGERIEHVSLGEYEIDVRERGVINDFYRGTSKPSQKKMDRGRTGFAS
ncbi:hypothetical protein FRC19_006910 [Serendipita sp. 401]|nr:hypothetical protein FRC19_006910 [Serendipita sp. 401]